MGGADIGTIQADILGQAVDLATAQTITGDKTFDGAISAAATSLTRIRAYKSAAQTITKNSWEKVELDAETYDSKGEFASYKFTATVAGYYLVIAHAGMVMELGKKLLVAIYKNGSAISYSSQEAVTATDVFIDVEDILSLAVGDYVEMYVYHGNGANTAIVADTKKTFMCVHRLL